MAASPLTPLKSRFLTYTFVSGAFVFGTLVTGALLPGMSIAGEAVVPYWQANYGATYTLNISNISNSPTDVNVSLYNKDGELYTGSYQTDNGGALNQLFTIPPHQTVWIWVNGPSGNTIGSTMRGYGVITSSPTNSTEEAAQIVAFGKYDGKGTHRWMGIPINNGLPF